MTADDARGRDYRRAVARRRGTADRPIIEDLEALAAGRLDHAKALQLLDRVMDDPDLTAEFELLRATHVAGRRLARPALPIGWLAAATVTLVASAGLLWTALRESPPVIRAGGGVALVVPRNDAEVRSPVVLTWRAVESTIRYRVSIADSAGNEVLAAAASDTNFAVPPTILRLGAGYRWWVEATTQTGVTIRSEGRRFTVVATGEQ